LTCTCVINSMEKRLFLTLLDISAEELQAIFRWAVDLKEQWKRGERRPLLPGRVIALLFEKPSLRTRVSFETAMAHLGGSSLFLGKDVGWGQRETAADFATVLGQYVDAVVYRTRSHERLDELARYSPCSVINGLSDQAHPCQAVADLFTAQELFGDLARCKVAYVGDANNVARSLAVACGMLDVEFALAAPAGYQFDGEFIQQLDEKTPHARRLFTEDPREAVADAQIVYTDVWASMGQEDEHAQRVRDLQPYQVNADLMRGAAKQARFLHCLPARRGEEVTEEVIDGPQSAIVQQASNRLHAQKGLLAWLLDAGSSPS
jgi:ornithine carbamoyltransferase